MDVAQYGGVGVDDHMVAYLRVAVDALDGVARLVEREAFRAERNALVQFHVVADDRRLADDHPRAVVDGEVVADGGTRVYVDARLRMRHFGDDARDKRHLQPQQGVGDAVVADGADGRVAEDDLAVALGRRVAVVGRLHVGLQQPAEVGQLPDEGRGLVLRRAFQVGIAGQRVVKAQARLDLLGKQPLQPLHVDADVIQQGLLVDGRLAEVAGEQQRPRQAHHLAQGFHRGHGHAVALLVANILQLANLGQLLYDVLHIIKSTVNGLQLRYQLSTKLSIASTAFRNRSPPCPVMMAQGVPSASTSRRYQSKKKSRSSPCSRTGSYCHGRSGAHSRYRSKKRVASRSSTKGGTLW